MRAIALSVSAVALLACIPPNPEWSKTWTDIHGISGTERDALDRAVAAGNSVSIAADKSSDAWGRAQTWIATHSTMKIQVVSDYVIETHNPLRPGQFGYSVRRTPSGDKQTIIVECASKYTFTVQRGSLAGSTHPLRPEHSAVLRKDCERNAAIAARFIESGEAVCPKCVAREREMPYY